jgi:predicted O-methyltransferase YrrM
MEIVTRSVLEELAEYGARHDAGLPDRLQRLRNMKPAAAALVALLVRVQRGGWVLEIGTSNGYSTIWTADAVRDHSGRLVTVEVEADRVDQARANLARAGLAEVVQVVHDDAANVLVAAPDASVSAVVLDAERPAYVAYWPDVVRILTAGGFVAVDNAVSHAPELTVFRETVDTTPGFRSDLFEVGDGVLVISRTGRVPIDAAAARDAIVGDVAARDIAGRPAYTAHERVRKRAAGLPPVGRHASRRRPAGAAGSPDHHGWVPRWTRLRGRPF